MEATGIYYISQQKKSLWNRTRLKEIGGSLEHQDWVPLTYQIYQKWGNKKQTNTSNQIKALIFPKIKYTFKMAYENQTYTAKHHL